MCHLSWLSLSPLNVTPVNSDESLNAHDLDSTLFTFTGSWTAWADDTIIRDCSTWKRPQLHVAYSLGGLVYRWCVLSASR